MGEVRGRDRQAPPEPVSQDVRPLAFAEFCRATGAAASLRSTFDDIAASYDRFRPVYSPELIDDVLELGKLREGSNVVEVGCGTGQATRSLARKGLNIDAIELSPGMAALAASNLADFPNAEVHVADFEEWTPGAPCDAVVAFTSFHLVDPARGYSAVRRSLRKDGSIVLVCTLRVVSGHDVFGARVASIFSSASPGMAEASAVDAREIWKVAESHSADIGELLSAVMGVPRFQTSPWFGPCTLRQRLWSATYTAQSYVELLGTYSTCNIVPAAQRDSVLNQVSTLIDREFGGSVEITFLNIVVAAPLVRS
jgi:SAM-dependent methyltransferase